MFLDKIIKPSKEHHKKSILKTISWRIVASTDTLLISWIITGDFSMASAIMSVEVVTKIFLYYFHERIWSRF
ncbi:MAG: DUF2061 domain-containing protein [Alphaproteobacteria bacterium]|nr:DUF2061 domain-containing protein [Alphaproteobacteria bacterium]|tara:strand:- start:595 stop:810 length:216 start_codon:yes stop_codon:yes gene_type:complete